jgi:hypothetical protein
MYSYIYITYVLWQHRHVIYNVYYYGSLIYSFTPSIHYKKVVQEEECLDDWVICNDQEQLE